MDKQRLLELAQQTETLAGELKTFAYVNGCADTRDDVLRMLREQERVLRDKLAQRERELETMCEYASRTAATLQQLQEKGNQ